VEFHHATVNRPGKIVIEVDIDGDGRLEKVVMEVTDMTIKGTAVVNNMLQNVTVKADSDGAGTLTVHGLHRRLIKTAFGPQQHG
jgi:hypothetical protein